MLKGRVVTEGHNDAVLGGCREKEGGTYHEPSSVCYIFILCVQTFPEYNLLGDSGSGGFSRIVRLDRHLMGQVPMFSGFWLSWNSTCAWEKKNRNISIIGKQSVNNLHIHDLIIPPSYHIMTAGTAHRCNLATKPVKQEGGLTTTRGTDILCYISRQHVCQELNLPHMRVRDF